MITRQLEQLLLWGVPKMTPEGAARFQQLMEEAVWGVVWEAFNQRELEAFHVTNMMKPLPEGLLK